jgi:hypothetical protein
MRVTTHQMVAEPAEESKGSGWSWAALAGALLLWAAAFPTWGLSVVLAPLTLLLSAVAWRRSSRDAVFWIGLGLNAFLVLGFLGEVVSVLIGESSVGWE